MKHVNFLSGNCAIKPELCNKVVISGKFQIDRRVINHCDIQCATCVMFNLSMFEGEEYDAL